MASDWRTLLELCSTIVDNRGKTCPVGKTGKPLIATNCVKNSALYPTYDTQRFVSEETYSSWFRGHPEPGDLIFVTKGSPGQVCIAPDPVDFCIAQDMVALRINKSLVYPPYLFALLRSREVGEQIGNMHVGSLIPHFKKGDFDKLYLQVPSEEIQTFAGDLYLALSERIDFLQGANKSLEGISRTIFRSWFVDCDPVLAKKEGREPEGMDAATADLFPDSFEASEIGEIPSGWRATKLGIEAERHGGRIQTGPFGSQLHASDYTDEGIPVVMPQDLSNRRVSTSRVARIRESDAVRLSRHRLEIGDIVYSRRGDVERHAQVSSRETGWLCGTGCLLVRMGPAWPALSFISLALDTPALRAWISQHAIGATLPNLNTGILAAVPLVVPSDTILRAFSEIVDPMEQLITENNAKAETLSMIRDTLLPRLISGKLRVHEAEKLVEAVL